MDEQIVPHARYGDDLGYIRIWVTPLRRLVFGMVPQVLTFRSWTTPLVL